MVATLRLLKAMQTNYFIYQLMNLHLRKKRKHVKSKSYDLAIFQQVHEILTYPFVYSRD